MSDSETSQDDRTGKTRKRNLPSWMSSRDAGGKSHGKGQSKKNVRNDPSGKESVVSSSGTADFSKLMDRVVFVLSGLVNPERNTLRSQALAMGAAYQPDWNSDCTLLVCAFPNTPKFRQVQADCGTIVSKEWISECYTQKRLVHIEQYLMHAGKPWRKSNYSHDISQDDKDSPPIKSQKQADKRSESKATTASSSHHRASTSAKEWFSPSEVRKWATDDLSRTIAWLESQDEKPEPSEIKQIAAEGIMTCLQDAIDSLEQKQDTRSITEQWNFIPRVVKELTRTECSEDKSASLSKEELCRQAKAWKQIYQGELKKLRDNDSSSAKTKKAKTVDKGKSRRNGASSPSAAGSDSDETIEMTEDEIELAYRNVASKLVG